MRRIVGQIEKKRLFGCSGAFDKINAKIRKDVREIFTALRDKGIRPKSYAARKRFPLPQIEFSHPVDHEKSVVVFRGVRIGIQHFCAGIIAM